MSAVDTLDRQVRFYQRVGEGTFRTDPYKVATGFLSHRMGRRAAGVHGRRYLARFLAEYLTRMGAGWVRPGQDDPYRTRDAFDTVYAIVAARLDHESDQSPPVW